MKRSFILLISLLLIGAPAWPAAAGAVKLRYKLRPGQVWIVTLSSQNEMTFMGQKNINRSKNVIEYRVLKGPKKGWVSLSASIKSSGGPSAQGGSPMDLSKLTFTADMHYSGEIRNVQHQGNAMPPPGPDLPPQMKAMYEQSSNMFAEAWKNAVFWFPEIPEDPLEAGDEFDVTRNFGMGGSGMGMQSQTVSKQVFTLDDVSEGLAYFTVRDRSVTKTKGMAGGRSATQTAGKGETVFDIKEGMWLDLTVKSRSKMNMSGVPGMKDMSQEMLQISKYEVEKK